jgi:thiamine pyrophosphokinase
MQPETCTASLFFGGCGGKIDCHLTNCALLYLQNKFGYISCNNVVIFYNLVDVFAP